MEKEFPPQDPLKTNLLGQILLEKGLITNAQLEKVLNIHKKEGGLLGNILVKLGFITEDILTVALRGTLLKTNLLGQILLGKGLITNAQLEKALNIQKKEGGLLGDILIRLGFTTEEILTIALATQAEVSYIPLEKYKIAKELLKLIPQDLMQKYCFVPLEKIDGVLTIAIVAPLDQKVINEIESITQYKVVCMFGAKSQIEKVINSYSKT